MRIRTWASALSVSLLALVACADDGQSGPTTPATVELSDLPGTLLPPPTPPSTSTTTSTTVAPTTSVEARSLLQDLAPAVGDDGSFRADDARFGLLADDTGRLTVRVPDVWPDRSTAPGVLSDGSAAPYLAISPDLTAFLDSYDAAGMALVVLPPERDPATALEDFTFPEDCQGGPATPFTTQDLAGEYMVWNDCGGLPTDIVTVAARPADGSFTAVLLVQILTDFDLRVLDEVLASIRVDP